ncbi:MAG: 16S rRNA (guanine(966)-N(2))-methyltransferase RsmD [Chlamydiales bacterium]
MQIIGGKHKKRKLFVPQTSLIRPTSSKLRETVFNICQQEIVGARFLDLFAGSGAMGLEALSRGAIHTTFVEKSALALIAIKRNVQLLDEENQTTILRGNVFNLIPTLPSSFDVIYADPPYGKEMGDEVLHQIDKYQLLIDGGMVFIEDSAFKTPHLNTLILKKTYKVGATLLVQYVQQKK